jgi:hypothetical protein
MSEIVAALRRYQELRLFLTSRVYESEGRCVAGAATALSFVALWVGRERDPLVMQKLF